MSAIVMPVRWCAIGQFDSQPLLVNRLRNRYKNRDMCTNGEQDIEIRFYNLRQ